MILYMIIYIPSGHQTWQLKFPNLERGFPTATFDYWRLFDLIWSLMLLRVTPPHRCNNCQRLQIQMADELPGWARLLQQLAVTRLAVARSARVSKPFELAEQLGVWQRVKQRVKLSQTWKTCSVLGMLSRICKGCYIMLYHCVAELCSIAAEWYQNGIPGLFERIWSWRDSYLVVLVGGCIGPGPGPVVGSSNM